MRKAQIHIQDSNDSQLAFHDWVPRQKSNDSIFGELINAPTCSFRLDWQCIEFIQPKVFKPKSKKNKIKKPCDYRKNICGYITKKIIREYLSQTYHKIVQQLCEKYDCSYVASKKFFLGKIEKITGPSHVISLFVPTNQSEVAIKAAFKQFFIWFTKERYLRYLILQGKMEQKQAYIGYKNTVLMSLVDQQCSGQSYEVLGSQMTHSFESS